MASQTDFLPTPTTLPASITAPPTVQFTPPAECYDANNNWVVTTSCYLDGPGGFDRNPDWLTCSLSVFGHPAWDGGNCNVPYPAKVTRDGMASYYTGCPVGFSTALASSYPGWNSWLYSDHYDATAYNVQCCPT